MSSRPCVLYRIYGDEDRLLYAGISTSPATRIKQHADEKPWWHEATRIDLEHFETEHDAADAERRAITDEAPVYNVSGGGRRMSEEERLRRKAEREATHENHLRQLNESYTPDDTYCTNCGWNEPGWV